jgi:hypothetical protein
MIANPEQMLLEQVDAHLASLALSKADGGQFGSSLDQTDK